jgi:hypothetical protein
MRPVALLAMAGFFAHAAVTHDHWLTGRKVPEWVKSSCCGPADVHRPTMVNVHTAPWNDDYMIVDGPAARPLSDAIDERPRRGAVIRIALDARERPDVSRLGELSGKREDQASPRSIRAPQDL